MSFGDANFRATETDAQRAIVRLIGELSEEGLNEAQTGVVQIVLAEAINNVVEHAYGKNGSGHIQVQYSLRFPGLDVLITDQGAAFAGESLPSGELPDVDVPVEHLPEGGFGWGLIRALTSNVTYERRDGSNRLMLGFDLSAA